MYMDPLIPHVVAMALAIMGIGLVLRRFNQPHVVAYILAGVLIGPSGLDLLTDNTLASRIGEYGVILLLFFVGMELPLRDLVRNWRAPVIGTTLEILFSVACIVPFGLILDWSPTRIVFLGFVISLSSTAVIMNVLRDGGIAGSRIARDVIGINIAQDVAAAPMLIALTLLAGTGLDAVQLSLQTVGILGIVVLFVVLVRRSEIPLPFAEILRRDPEMQVFAALFLCFGFALITGLLHLSAALGAFVAGVVLSATRDGTWMKDRIEPFRVVFVGLFFVSVGMLVDLGFVGRHIVVISLLVAVVLATGTAINAVVLRAVGHDWRSSIFGGSLLAHIGEFSFVLAAVALANGIIMDYSYQMTISIICFSMLLSPAWIALVRRSVRAEIHPGSTPD